MQGLLEDNQIIGGYTVNFLIKKSQYNESYCVTNSDEAKFFLKIYKPEKCAKQYS